ncbi:MAG: inositol monophosphatase [Nocardioides sp.]|nr:inositol monophosphatase [Nocardioides sp.]
METDDITALLHEVAATVITPRFRSLADGEVHEKNPGDLVTVADREAEAVLTERLSAAHPDAVVVGEEAVAGDPGLLDRYTAADHAFIIDPVDGTKNFVQGSPDHAVMLAELRDRAVVRGWIHHPQHATTYVAERGAGAFRDGERLRAVVPDGEPATWRGTTSRRPWLRRSLDGLAPLELTWVCCGVDYVRLLEGEAAYLLYRNGKPWDHAPGSLLLAEAGGTLVDVDGAAYDPTRLFEGVMVAAGSPDVAAVVREAWRRGDGPH